MARSFGIELEGYNCTPAQIAAALQRVGIDARAENYNHATRTWWKVTTDASIQDDAGRARVGFELVSPVLYDTPDTWRDLAIILKAVRKAGAKVNTSTGFHVHIGVSDLTVTQFRNVVKKWVKYEDLIDGFMPVTRRRSANYYCQSNIRLAGHVCTESAQFKGAQKDLFKALDTCSTVRQLISLVHPVSEGGANRYRKLNLTSYLVYGTMEFRQHSGTFDTDKVCNWIQFLLKFVDGAIQHSKIHPRFQNAPRENRINTLLRGLHDGKLSRYYRKRLADLNPSA